MSRSNLRLENGFWFGMMRRWNGRQLKFDLVDGLAAAVVVHLRMNVIETKQMVTLPQLVEGPILSG